MAETVGQHQTGAFTVPVAGQTNAASNVLTNDNALRSANNAHDSDAGVHLQSGVSANRPAFGTAGVKWLTTDTRKLYYDTGTAWVEIDYAGVSTTQTLTNKTLTAPTITGPVITSGTIASLTSFGVGAGGTAFTQFVVYSVSLTPSTVATLGVQEVTFAVTGVTTADKILVNYPAFSNNVTPVAWRVNATDAIAGVFLNMSGATSSAAAAGTYKIVAIRS